MSDVLNPKAQSKEGARGRDKVVSGAVGALTAAGIAGAAGVAAPVVLGAAAVGGLAGLIVGDQSYVLPIDMVAIPAYQAYLIQGAPQFTLYIKAGETILATGGNVDDVMEGVAEAGAVSTAPKKRRKKNPWIQFNKKFKFRAKRKNESSQQYLRMRTKAARTAYNKQKRGGK